MPKPTHTKLQNFRCPQADWDAARARAAAEGTDLSKILRQVVEDYGTGKPVRLAGRREVATSA